MPNQFRDSTSLEEAISADPLECPDCKHIFTHPTQSELSQSLSCPACGISRESIDFVSTNFVEKALQIARKKMANACNSESCDG